MYNKRFVLVGNKKNGITKCDSIKNINFVSV